MTRRTCNFRSSGPGHMASGRASPWEVSFAGGAAFGQGKGAFTLVELLIVLSLIAVLAAVLLPEMRGSWEAERLRSASGKLVRAMHLAASQSIAWQRPHQVRLDVATRLYVVEPAAAAGADSPPSIQTRDLPDGHGMLEERIDVEIRPWQAGADPGAEDEEQARPYPSRVVPGEEDAVAFYPDGTAEAKEILLRDQQGFGFSLRVNPVTARVQVVTLARDGPL